MNGAKVFVLLVALLLIIPSAKAIAIAPATIDIVFEPNAHKEFELHIINNDAKPAEVTLYVKGGLSKYISLPVQSLSLGPNQIQKINIMMGLPEAMPADNTARVGASVPVGDNGKGISAIAAVESIVTLRGASSAQQSQTAKEKIRQENSEAKLELRGVTISRHENSADLDITVANVGNTATEAYAEAKLETDIGGNSELKTDSSVVLAGESKVLTANLQSALASAPTYRADVVVYYGKNSIKKSVVISGKSVTDVPQKFKIDYIIIAAILFIFVADLAFVLWRRARNL